MKPGVRLDFRSEIERLVSGIDPGSVMNEVPLLGTGIKIYMFQVSEGIFFSIHSVIDIFRCLGSGDPVDVRGHSSCRNYIRRLREFGESFENGDLEVICSDFLTNEFFMEVKKRADSRREEMKAYFDQIDIEQFSGNMFHVSGNGTDTSDGSVERPESYQGMNGYPFDGQWTDSIMDGILKNIYTNDDPEGAGKMSLDISRMGRGRHVRPSGNLKDRPFVCTYKDCKRAFKRYEHLKRHNLMHTGERPHKCKFPGCSKSFSRSDNLSQHYKIHNVTDRMHTKTYESYRQLNKEFN